MEPMRLSELSIMPQMMVHQDLIFMVSNKTFDKAIKVQRKDYILFVFFFFEVIDKTKVFLYGTYLGISFLFL